MADSEGRKAVKQKRSCRPTMRQCCPLCEPRIVGNKKAAQWRQSGRGDSFTPYLILKYVSVKSQVHYNDVRFLYTLRAKEKPPTLRRMPAA